MGEKAFENRYCLNLVDLAREFTLRSPHRLRLHDWRVSYCLRDGLSWFRTYNTFKPQAGP